MNTYTVQVAIFAVYGCLSVCPSVRDENERFQYLQDRPTDVKFGTYIQ